MKQHAVSHSGFELLAGERDSLVRLCAHLSGRPDMAEDLAQDTLVEAWRQRHKLREPAGKAHWLAAVARNICLRWRYRHGREQRYLSLVSSDADTGTDLGDEARLADEVDVEIDLERRELAELLDRALTLLPPLTRQALLLQYAEDLPQIEIATRLGMSEGAVAVRVHRGKVALRRELLRDLPSAGESYLPTSAAGSWETTRLWCALCGRRRLLGRMRGDPVTVTVRCPASDGLGGCQMESRVPGSPIAVGYGRAISLVRREVDRRYGLNRSEEAPRCPGCGRATPLRVGGPDGLPRELQTPGVHVYLHCDACGALSHSSMDGIALSLSVAQRFLRRHPRVQAWPYREIEVDGLPAYLSRFESLDDGARLDVLVRQDTFRLIAVHGAPKA